jgi:L,D-peptidoglycan transpeptidase YkuD (ErfK/YbiS/YcfS/YnhG family)
MPDIRIISRSELEFDGKTYRCAVGANGFTDTPKEGGKATPLGIYPLRECWYRADRMAKPATLLPLKVIHEDDGWCDDPTQPEYNRHVKLPYCGSHENLFREEHVYDIIVPIGFNDSPVVPGKGSAIFLHLAHADYSPTLGCVAVALDDMLLILEKLTLQSRIVIAPRNK